MKKKNGFTLIELLAVIIILGILMIIAIPSVTSYINNSRKLSYINSMNEIVKGAATYVNSGELDLSDTDTTYYIPTSKIPLENGKLNSPFGDVEEAYVAVTFDGEGYNYYFTGRDTARMGVVPPTKMKELDIDKIVNDVDEIDKTITLDGTHNVKVLKEDGTWQDIDPGVDDEITPSPLTKDIYWALQDNNNDGKNETLIISSSPVTGADYGIMPKEEDYVAPVWCSYDDGEDCVDEPGTKMVPWNGGDIERDNPSYRVTTVRVEGNVVPKTTASWFYGVGYGSDVINMDLRNLDLSNVTDMSGMFSLTGYNAKTCNLQGIEDFVTNNVTDMSGVFNHAFGYCKNFDLNLSKWKTGKVTTIAGMFRETGYFSSTFKLNVSTWKTKNVVKMGSTFYGTGSRASTWQIIGLENWNTSNVNDMSSMFEGFGTNANEIDLSGIENWDISKVTSLFNNLSSIGGYNSIIHLDLRKWDVSHVTSFHQLFYELGKNSKELYLDISTWDTSNVTGMGWFLHNVNPTNYTIIIPRTNNNGLENTKSIIYGKTESVNASPVSGKYFTLAPEGGDLSQYKTKFCQLTLANNNSLTRGDELTLDTEHFYVLSTNSNETTLIAKYNLFVGDRVTNRCTSADCATIEEGHTEISSTTEGYGLQNANANAFNYLQYKPNHDSMQGMSSTSNGLVAFSGTNYWDSSICQHDYNQRGIVCDTSSQGLLAGYANSSNAAGTTNYQSVYPYVYDSSISTIKQAGREYNACVVPGRAGCGSSYFVDSNGYSIAYYLEDYVRKLRTMSPNSTIVTGRLITYEEAAALPLTMVGRQSFFTGSAGGTQNIAYVGFPEEGSSSISSISPSLKIGFYGSTYSGVRPVIVVKTSDIKLNCS